MSKAFGRDTCYVSVIGLSADRGAQFLGVYKPRKLDQCRTGRSIGLDACPRRSACAPPIRTGRSSHFRAITIFSSDRGTRGRRAIQAALYPCRREQRLSRPDPSGPARLRHGLSGAVVVRKHQRAGTWRLRASTTSPSPKVSAARRSASPTPKGRPGGVRDGAPTDGAVSRARGGRIHPRARDQHRDGHPRSTLSSSSRRPSTCRSTDVPISPDAISREKLLPVYGSIDPIRENTASRTMRGTSVMAEICCQSDHAVR